MNIGALWEPHLDTFEPKVEQKTAAGRLRGGSGAVLEKEVEMCMISEPLKPFGLSSLSRDSSVFNISPHLQKSPKMTPK